MAKKCCRYYYRYADDIVILGESKAHLRNVLVAIKLYLKIESAIIFWFKDVDCKAENKVVEYLGEY